MINYGRVSRIITDMNGIQAPVKAGPVKSRPAVKAPQYTGDEGQDNFMEFLSTKAQAFSAFDDMASFAVSILKASSYPFFIVDKKMKVQFMNPACLKFTGLNLNDAIGKVECMRVFNSNLCNKKCAIKQAMDTQKSVIGKRVKVLDKAGKEHTIIVTAGPLIDKKGRVLGGFEVWRDAMPDEEVALRNKRLLDTVKNYCWGMEKFIEGVEGKPFPKELENKENWDRFVGDMKKRVGGLRDHCDHFMKSTCWDILNCPPERQVQCPAFPNHGAKCWEVDYTWCDGQMQGTVNEKKDKCRKCFVYVREKVLS